MECVYNDGMSREESDGEHRMSVEKNEARRASRYVPAVCCRVTDMLSGALLGEVLNVSREGLMLLSRQSIDEGSMYQVSIDCDMDGADSIEAGIECLWSDEHGNGGTVAGFHIIDISSQGQACLDRLLRSFTQ